MDRDYHLWANMLRFFFPPPYSDIKAVDVDRFGLMPRIMKKDAEVSKASLVSGLMKAGNSCVRHPLAGGQV
ncbi:MAG: hypothetical protein LBQ79_03490 [Deltaproteobacteria bacterium]|nr:hypothetical protein [Deltaproteobacteria bacterium]